jgi:hypothetical protein
MVYIVFMLIKPFNDHLRDHKWFTKSWRWSHRRAVNCHLPCPLSGWQNLNHAIKMHPTPSELPEPSFRQVFPLFWKLPLCVTIQRCIEYSNRIILCYHGNFICSFLLLVCSPAVRTHTTVLLYVSALAKSHITALWLFYNCYVLCICVHRGS